MSVHSHPVLVRNRLSELGLTAEELRESVRDAEFERRSCTENDPSCTPGYELWRWTVRRLRERKTVDGWRRHETNNLPLVVNPVLGIAIAVTSGNEATGFADYTPTTKYPKGSVTASYVRLNRRQLVLWSDDEPSLVPMPSDDEMVTWILLIRPGHDGVVRSELSLPAEMDDGYVTAWHERILLAPVRLDEEPEWDQDDDDEGDFDIAVTPRGH